MTRKHRPVSEIDAAHIELDSDVRRRINKEYKEQMKIWAPQLVKSNASPATKGLMVMLTRIFEKKSKSRPIKKPRRPKGKHGGYCIYDIRVLRRFGEWMQTLELEKGWILEPIEETLVDYDKENDVCYISFYTPPRESDGSQSKGDFIFRFKNGEPIGVTIMNFSRYENLIKLLIENPKERSINRDEKGRSKRRE